MILLPVSSGFLTFLSTRLMSVPFGHVVGTELFLLMFFLLSSLPRVIRYQLNAIIQYLTYSELFILLTIVKNYKTVKSLNIFIILIYMLNFFIIKSLCSHKN